MVSTTSTSTLLGSPRNATASVLFFKIGAINGSVPHRELSKRRLAAQRERLASAAAAGAALEKDNKVNSGYIFLGKLVSHPQLIAIKFPG